MKLLLAEDEPLLGVRLRDEFVRRGFAVDLATNGVDAQYLGDEGAPDCVILDLGLPQRPGLEVLRNWRRCGNAVPVLVLTGRGAWHEKVAGFQAGADDYLAKPFHFEELLARVQALIRRRHGHLAPHLCGAGLTLDEERQAVLCEDGTKALSGVEFRLLRYMMLHPGKVLSKNELADHVYDSNADKESNVIEVHVSHLRQKVGKHRIVTKRGQGYVFGERG